MPDSRIPTACYLAVTTILALVAPVPTAHAQVPSITVGFFVKLSYVSRR